MYDMGRLVLLEELSSLLLVPMSDIALIAYACHANSRCVPQVRLRGANKEPFLATALSEVRVCGLVLDNILDALADETSTTSNKDSSRHCFRCRRLPVAIDRELWGWVNEDVEEDVSDPTKLLTFSWALAIHADCARRASWECRERPVFAIILPGSGLEDIEIIRPAT